MFLQRRQYLHNISKQSLGLERSGGFADIYILVYLFLLIYNPSLCSQRIKQRPLVLKQVPGGIKLGDLALVQHQYSVRFYDRVEAMSNVDIRLSRNEVVTLHTQW